MRLSPPVLRFLVGIGIGATLAVSAAAGSVAYRVKDLNPDLRMEPRHGVCGEVIDFGSKAYFEGRDWSWECDLFRTDATPAGASKLVDLAFLVSESPTFLGAVGPFLYFCASTPEHGRELWRTDGTPLGTILLRDLTPGSDGACSSSWSWGAAAGARAVLAVEDEARGTELWVSDGSPEGTAMLLEIAPGPWSGVRGWTSPKQLGDLVLFVADDRVAGPEVWRSDGTAAGTFPVSALDVEPDSDPLVGLEVLGDVALFTAALGGGDWGLWRTDGTPGGTQLVWTYAVSDPYAAIRYPLVAGARAYFEVDPPGQPAELWSTDGTVGGTARVAVVGAASPQSNLLYPAAAGSRLFFLGNDGIHGHEPWVSDGTAVGTHMARDVRPGPDGSIDWDIDPPITAALGESAVLLLDDGVRGTEVWISDGTEAGSLPLTDLVPGAEGSWPRLHAMLDGRRTFSAMGANGVRELYATDGTVAGTIRLTNLGRAISPSYPHELTAVQDRLYFVARVTSASRDRPWHSDGSETGTVELAGSLGACYRVYDFEPLDDGTVVGLADDGEWSLLWATDGSTIEQLGDFAESCGSHHDCPLTGGLHGAGPVVLFSYGGDGRGREPWSTDGSVAGTGQFVDLWPGAPSSWPRAWLEVEGGVWFTAAEPFAGEQLWFSGGTPQSTSPLVDLASDDGWLPQAMALWPLDQGTPAFFVVRASRTGWAPYGLWFHGGGEPYSSRMVESVSWPRLLGVLNGRALFAADASGYAPAEIGEEPWVSDGTPAGTLPLRDIWPGPTGSSIGAAARLGELVYFRACEPEGGCELWSSDGTSAGTRRAVDLVAGLSSSYPSDVVAEQGRLYFAACMLATGCEVWVSDGTPAGTHRATDIAPGAASGMRNAPPGYGGGELVASRGRLFFPADDGTGTELWAMPIELFYDGFETGDLTRWSGVGEP